MALATFEIEHKTRTVLLIFTLGPNLQIINKYKELITNLFS